MNLKNIINEEISNLFENDIYPPDIPNTLNFWHGGNLDSYDEFINHKKGRYEYGPGLYLTTNYSTAARYAKGSRKLYLITVELGNDINYSFIDINEAFKFIDYYVLNRKKKEITQYMNEYVKDGKIKAYLFNNLLLNHEALKPTNLKELRKFYVSKGIDYDIHNGSETMMVLYNMKKIKNLIRIQPKDNIKVFDLK